MGSMQDLFYTLIGGRALGFEEERKRSVLMLFLVIGLTITLPFAVHHFRLGNTVRAILIVLLASVHLASLLTLPHLQRGTFLFRANVILLGAYLFFLLMLGGTQGSRMLWAFTFPLFSFFLLGKREGLFWSALLFLCSLLLFLSPPVFLTAFPYEKETTARFLLTYAVVVAMSYIVEATRKRYQDATESSLFGLEERVDQRTGELQDANDKLQKEMRDRETILSSLMEHVIYEDRDMKILWANRAACESAGMSQNEIIGRHCYKIWPHREDPCPDCPVRTAMETGKPQAVEKTTQDGRTWLIRGYPVRDARNEIVGGIEVTLEVTEQKRAEAALSEAHHILNMSPATAFLWRNEKGWPVEFVTNNVETLLGYSANDLVSGRISYSEVIHPDDLDRVTREVSFYTESGRGDKFVHEPYRILTRQGQEKWVEDSTHIRRDREGIITHYQGIVLDITGRKRTEDERAKLQAQLLQAQKMESIGRLAGGVAHDFNNMLGVIIGNAEIAAMDLDPASPLFGNLQEIMKAGQRSAELVRQLLAFARKQTVRPKVVDLNDTIPGTLKMLRRLIGEDIHLVWMPGHDLWNVKVDPSQIDQILANLAVNAKDAISGPGKMTIETDNVSFDSAYCAGHPGFVPGQYVLLAVSDDGAGMSQETLQHLFEPFFTTKEIGKGTGLGLATIYGIVKQNGGFIQVYSEPGEGTTFKIYLPRFEAEALATEAGDDVVSLQRGTETVLLVEDEGAILTIGKTMLESLGYRVLVASSPHEAIRMAIERSTGIDLLLTDVVMPEMNGRELAERLRLAHPDLKCLFMSGYTANVIAHHGVLDKGINFIHKPFSMKDLAAKVREALDKE